MSGNENDQPAEYWWGDGLAVTPRLLEQNVGVFISRYGYWSSSSSW
eukprot:CAMPEP_0185814082 /NCGR_PEP_ID=MMETSP1322-20130828/12988_1 /TAXON_ID=265543 /ORGANISM="Minutocellus polymorphus, Strain RCC2270" /LENGTH=45 /DNA_ID= /DNA_START= /DNA_END= /DNA_ORIENTATION=